MYPISAGLVIETKELWEELMGSLKELAVRVVLELSEVPAEWSTFLDANPDAYLKKGLKYLSRR